jgi:hypothetical protein
MMCLHTRSVSVHIIITRSVSVHIIITRSVSATIITRSLSVHIIINRSVFVNINYTHQSRPACMCTSAASGDFTHQSVHRIYKLQNIRCYLI